MESSSSSSISLSEEVSFGSRISTTGQVGSSSSKEEKKEEELSKGAYASLEQKISNSTFANVLENVLPVNLELDHIEVVYHFTSDNHYTIILV